MLSFVFSLPIIAVTLWLTTRTASRMRRLQAGWRWWGLLLLVVGLGGYAGFWLGRYDLQVSPTFRWEGLPLPIGFFALEEGRWTDFIPPPPIQWTNLLADILAPILILLLPIFVIWRRRDRVARAG